MVYVPNSDLPSQLILQAYIWGKSTTPIVQTALPLMRLYKPARRPVKAILGVVRIATHLEKVRFSEREKRPFALLELSFSIAVVAAKAVFGHAIGQATSSANHVMFKGIKLVKNCYKGAYAQAAWDGLEAVSHALYLAFFFSGRRALKVASLAIKVLSRFYHSQDPFAKGQRMKGACRLILTLAKSRQLIAQVKALRFSKRA